MTVLQRAAAIAALTFSLTGLLATSTPGMAAQLEPTAPVAQSAVFNPQAPASVPSARSDSASAAPQVDEAASESSSNSPRIMFASLDAAVAAQDDANADETLRCLAGAVYFEAKGEPLAGQLAVAKVIINRAKSGRFANNVCGVVTQRGQFGFVRGGTIPTIDASRPSWKRAVAVAKVAMADSWQSKVSDALYFNTPNRRPASRAIKIAAIGNHVFYR
ncbi:MAG TPA: cell wall hydrolase [Sphingomonas sp.]|jgi:spore germination cell wall hydrolase CwlJ-like protein|nr:cell wall hydrolase [Sphingomonas sp.]